MEVTLEISYLVASQHLHFFCGRKLGLYRPATWMNSDYSHFRLLFSKIDNRLGKCGKQVDKTSMHIGQVLGDRMQGREGH